MEKPVLYRLVIEQLVADGYEQAARAVAEASLLPLPTDAGSQHLATYVRKGMEQTIEVEMKDDDALEGGDHDLLIGSDRTCVDFDEEENNPASARVHPNFATRFITTHKQGCRVAKFSHDGNLVATGSADTSIKLIDVERMKHYSEKKEKSDRSGSSDPGKPVLRTFYDHAKTVNDLDFHPHSPFLVSASNDCTIKFFDYSRSSAKRAFRYLQDTDCVRSLSFHPSGDFLLAGTDQCMVRLYDVNSFKPYTCAEASEHHTDAVNQVRYAPDAVVFASCSKDGDVKIWDGVSMRCVRTIHNAHLGFDVSCVQFSRNLKYLLSGGKDSTIRLWDVSTGRQLRTFTGCTAEANRMQSTFSYNEDFVITSDEKAISTVVFDTRTGEQLQRLTGHNNTIRWVCASPVENALMTASDDHRARFWVGRT